MLRVRLSFTKPIHLFHQLTFKYGKISGIEASIIVQIPRIPVRKNGIRYCKQPFLQQNRIHNTEIAVRIDIACDRFCRNEQQSVSRELVLVVKPDGRVLVGCKRIVAVVHCKADDGVLIECAVIFKQK